MSMFYLLPKDTNGQEKSKNRFPVVENEGSEKQIDLTAQNGLDGLKNEL